MRLLGLAKLVPRTGFSLLFCSALLFTAPTAAFGQEIGSLFVSANYSLGDYQLRNNFTTHRVDDLGISAGFIIPVVTRTYGLHYKGRVAFHGVEDIRYGSNPSPNDWKYYRNLDQYVSSLNEFLVGRRFDLGSNWYLHPLIGFGVLVNIIYGNHGEGLAYGSFEFDFTTQAMHRLKRFDVGVQVTFEYVPWDTYFGTANVRYITLGAVIAK
jgi:hypothetical protein